MTANENRSGANGAASVVISGGASTKPDYTTGSGGAVDPHVTRAISFFNNCHDVDPQPRDIDFPTLAKLLTNHDRRPEKDGRLFLPGMLKKDATRAKENVELISHAVETSTTLGQRQALCSGGA